MNIRFGNIEVICDLDKWNFCGMECADFQLKWVDEKMGCEGMKAEEITHQLHCLFCRGCREMGHLLGEEGGNDAIGVLKRMIQYRGKIHVTLLKQLITKLLISPFDRRGSFITKVN